MSNVKWAVVEFYMDGKELFSDTCRLGFKSIKDAEDSRCRLLKEGGYDPQMLQVIQYND